MARITEFISVRKAFLEWASVYPKDWDDLDLFAANVQGEKLRLRELLERFEDSEDILPDECCHWLELPKGSTFGDAVDLIRQELDLA